MATEINESALAASLRQNLKQPRPRRPGQVPIRPVGVGGWTQFKTAVPEATCKSVITVQLDQNDEVEYEVYDRPCSLYYGLDNEWQLYSSQSWATTTWWSYLPTLPPELQSDNEPTKT